MPNLKGFFYYLSIAAIFFLIGWFGNNAYRLPEKPDPAPQIKPTPLLKYSIENLSKAEFKSSEIVVGNIIKDTASYSSYEFTMKFSPDFSGNLKKTSGMINIPKGSGPFPVIVMYRGYVNQETYKVGEGTSPSASFFAQNGFITVAPDFLGYGDSDPEAANIFESRFQTYVTAVSVLKSVGSVKEWDGTNIFIWGHSNGGQIALTALEITGVSYPTVLWAPVTKPFPASILYYIDEASDSGRLIIGKLAEFNETYDAGMFSLTRHFDKIKAPIQLNQGTADTAVPYWWSDSFVETLEEGGIDITYIKYPGANHNFLPLWNQAVNSSLLFFESYLR